MPQKIVTDYGTCPNGCLVREYNQDGPTEKWHPVELRKRGHALFCQKCGYHVDRANVISAQRRGILDES